MGLFPELDKKATISNVRKFFDDGQYQKIKRNALSDGIKAQVNDITGIRGSSRGNSSERMMIYYAECAQAKRAILKAVDACSVASQDIMKLRYMRQLKVWKVKEQLTHDLGHTSYSDSDKFACLEFAEACDRFALEMNVDPEILPVFLEFEKAGTNQEQNGKEIGTK